MLQSYISWGRRGRDHMVVGFTTTCTKVVSSNPTQGGILSTKICDSFSVTCTGRFFSPGGVLQFPQPIKLTATI